MRSKHRGGSARGKTAKAPIEKHTSIFSGRVKVKYSLINDSKTTLIRLGVYFVPNTLSGPVQPARKILKYESIMIAY